MAKLRIYVETSVWSFAFAEDVPDYRADTEEFFQACRHGKFDCFIGDTVVAEVVRAPKPIRDKIAQLIREVRPVLLRVSPSALRLADMFLKEHVVPPAKLDDARHVATAYDAGLEVLLSWNYRHLVNVRRAEAFWRVAASAGYNQILQIATPPEVLYGDDS